MSKHDPCVYNSVKNKSPKRLHHVWRKLLQWSFEMSKIIPLKLTIGSNL